MQAIHKNEATPKVSWDDVATLLMDSGYTPADDVAGDGLCAYLEIPTGLDVIDTVTVLATFYEDAQELFVEVASTSYAHGIHNGSPDDMFITFISRDTTIPSVEAAKRLLAAGEKAAHQYILAMSIMEDVKV